AHGRAQGRAQGLMPLCASGKLSLPQPLSRRYRLTLGTLTGAARRFIISYAAESLRHRRGHVAAALRGDGGDVDALAPQPRLRVPLRRREHIRTFPRTRHGPGGVGRISRLFISRLEVLDTAGTAACEIRGVVAD